MIDFAEGSCCICLDSLDVGGRQRLSCGHVLHENCVMEMRRHGASGRCPICRKVGEDLTPVQLLIDKAVAYYLQGSFSEAFRQAF